MLLELFQGIVDLARKGQEPQPLAVTTVDGEPNKRYITKPDGTVDTLEVPPAERNHRSTGLDSFIEACQHYGESGTVWHNQNKCVLVTDDNKRREFVTLELEAHPRWQKLHGEIRGNQKAFIAMLKKELDDSLPDGLISSLRTVECRRSSDGTRTIDHGAESLGRSVEATVQGRETIPEYINVNLPVYKTAGLSGYRVPVRCSLDIDVENEQFSLTPISGELDQAMVETQRHITDVLSGELDIPVFQGAFA